TGPPRPSFRCFILFTIRLSVLSRSRNRLATALQSFSIHRCSDGEIQVSRRATFVARNLLPGVPHKLCRLRPDDQYDVDAPGSGGCVHCATGTRSSSPDPRSAERDTRFWPRVHLMNLRSFVVDGRDVVRSFLRSGLSVCAIFSPRARRRSSRRCARQTVWTNPDGSHHFSRRQGIRSFLCRGDEL